MVGRVNRSVPITERNAGTTGLLFMSPALIIILATVLFPIAYASYLSLHRWNLKRPMHPFVGLENYGDILQDPRFWGSLQTTLVFAALSVALIMLVGFLLALLLNERFKGRGVLRAMLLIPWAIPHVVNGLMWKWLLDPSYGIVNGMLTQSGVIGTYRSWLTSMPSAMAWSVFAYAWKDVPLATILILAGLQTIPGELYEAATVDGAGRWQRLRSITIPSLRPTLLVVLIFETMFALKVFDIIYVLTGGGPGNATTVLGWMIYNDTFVRLSFGSGSALAIVLGLITLSISVFYFRLLRGDGK
ncbi:Carbohydrate ABC transporter membrane protein 1, CUT1 family [Limnochorda pilosa]|uniref:Carbohydrate ABC transporter membrane protein 1, CUT1 family n=2 Tax=Limnochorda pilosa TaxID=1555112 RepID=A0A0K2SM10_LIMPI|nr:Carbohydrate ABC transporter membrane protein 1, CUT1 family [Limnochorda pilosa]